MPPAIETFKNSVTDAFRNYAVFEGRAGRAQFWYFYLFWLIVCVILDILKLDLLYAVFTLATLVPFTALTARRLHDVNRSGWWQLIALTVIGLIPLIYWLAQPSVTDENRF